MQKKNDINLNLTPAQKIQKIISNLEKIQNSIEVSISPEEEPYDLYWDGDIEDFPNSHNGIDLNKKKYKVPNKYQQEKGLKMGLSREQVSEPNFADYTLKAISNIQKRTKELSLVETFEMVKGKTSKETEKIVKAYLETTKKAQKPINEIALIRVLVCGGRGFGHQRAAITLMKKLREMGFKGTFDIQCEDQLGEILTNTQSRAVYKNEEPLVSSNLISMIPGFELAEPNTDGVRVVSGLGALKIYSLPHDYTKRDTLGLPKVDLAVCAATDDEEKESNPKKILNAASYINLEPTDWHQGSCFVEDQDGIIIELPSASKMRLSSMTAYQLPDLSSIALSVTEQKIIDITRNTEINSQLVYGLYPEWLIDITSFYGMRESGNLNEATEMQRILDANLLISQKTSKPSILLLPQKIALDDKFIGKVKCSNVYFIDITKSELDIRAYKAGDVIVVYTGCLQQAVFDHLMLEGTTLPPVIEGCNAKEACESAGRPFIHGSGKHKHLKQYKIKAVDKQELHTQASLCLEQGESKYIPQLLQYMEESLTANPELIAYHRQRREAFLKRLDACEVAFDTLGISYKKGIQKSAIAGCRAMFFSHQKYADYLSEHRNDSPEARREFDQQFGLMNLSFI